MEGRKGGDGWTDKGRERDGGMEGGTNRLEGSK